MAAGDLLPTSFIPMGAEFIKPYMEFEFEGEIHRLEGLAGGHNGRVASACASRPPVFDPERQRWVVPIENNLIDIDLGAQPEVAKAIPAHRATLRAMTVISNPRNSYKSTGVLLSETRSPTEQPRFPVDCIFSMHIRVRVPGRPSLITVRPFQLIATGLEQWPPAVGTIYRHEDTVELFPEWMPFSERLMKPVVRILPGDETVLTRVFEAPLPQVVQTRRLLRRLIDRLT